MPIYEYECEKCHHHFELIQRFSDLPVQDCPLCKGGVRKVISSPGIMFKGSGWYVTDYSNKLKNSSGENKTKPESKEKEASDKKEQPKETTTTTVPPAPSAKSNDNKN